MSTHNIRFLWRERKICRYPVYAIMKNVSAYTVVLDKRDNGVNILIYFSTKTRHIRFSYCTFPCKHIVKQFFSDFEYRSHIFTC